MFFLMDIQNNRWIQLLQANRSIVCIQLGRKWQASLHQALKQKPLITMVLESVASNNFPPKGETFTLSPTATTLSSPLVRRRRQHHFPLPLFVADGNTTFLSPCSSPTATTLSSPLVRRRRQHHFPLPLFVADGNNTFLSPCSSPTATTLSSPLVRRRRQQHFPLPLFVADGTRTGFTLLKANYSKSNVKLLVVYGASCSPWLQIQNFTQSWSNSFRPHFSESLIKCSKEKVYIFILVTLVWIKKSFTPSETECPCPTSSQVSVILRAATHLCFQFIRLWIFHIAQFYYYSWSTTII